MARPSDLRSKMTYVFSMVERNDVPVRVIFVGRSLFTYIHNTAEYSDDIWGSDIRMSKVLPPWAIIALPGYDAEYGESHAEYHAAVDLDLAKLRLPRQKYMKRSR